MQLSNEQLLNLTEIAKQAALQAGSIIQKACVEELNIQTKEMATSLASSVFTKVDLECQESIHQALASSISEYDLGWLGEESQDDHSRLKKDYFWCVDPLDGTLSFIKQRAGFCVSIALINQKGIPVIGVVLNPNTSDLYHATYQQGAYKNNEAMRVNYHENITLINDESFVNTEYYQTLKDKLEFKNKKIVSQILQGGAVMNAIWCIEYAPACYVKYPKKTEGGGSIWDYASATCIYNELGLNATDFDRQPLNLNKAGSVFMNEKGVIMSTLLDDSII